jgi:hypothetical protein
MPVLGLDKYKMKKIFKVLGRPTHLSWRVRYLGKNDDAVETKFSIEDPTDENVTNIFFGGNKDGISSGYETKEGYQLCRMKAEWLGFEPYKSKKHPYSRRSTITCNLKLTEYSLSGSLDPSTNLGKQLLLELIALFPELKVSVSLTDDSE